MGKDLIRQISRTISKYQMVAPGDCCLVAVSGGPDSMALAHILWRLRDKLSMHLHLAHFNHGLRPQALRDEQVVVRLAKTLALPLSLERAEGLTLKGRSVEEAARQARYSFLDRAKESVGATKIALGHTADDQVETILMNFFRGAGTRGLGGMVPIREGLFIRPLLETGRKQVADYCRSEGLEPTLDETNLDLRFTRNWIRLRLMPLLDDRFAGWKKAVLRCGRLAAEESEALAEWVREMEKNCIRASDEASVTLSLASLKEASPALRGAVLRDCLARVAGSPKDLGEAVVGELWALANSRAGYITRQVRKGLWAEKEYDRLRLFRSSRSEAVPSPGCPPWQEVTLRVPGQALVPEIGLTLSATEARPQHNGKAGERTEKSDVEVFDLARLGRSLKVRAWQPGDGFSPPGLQGHKKLQDFFVDKKVPRPKRGKIPIVTDEKGRIAWVVGYAIDDRVKVGPHTERVAVLRAVWSAEEARG